MATSKKRSVAPKPWINLNVLALLGMVIIGIVAIVAMNGHFRGEYKKGDGKLEAYGQP